MRALTTQNINTTQDMKSIANIVELFVFKTQMPRQGDKWSILIVEIEEIDGFLDMKKDAEPEMT